MQTKCKKGVTGVLVVLYSSLIIPMLYSMFNSVPACDDFAFGTRSISNNLFMDAVGFSKFCWFDHSGRWLIYFLQKLINPLNCEGHLGHIYGVWDIVLFFIVFIMTQYSLRVIFRKILQLDDTLLNISIFLVLAILYTTYYYSEAYNWFIGATAYALTFGLVLLTIAFTIRFEETGILKYYIGIFLAGVLPATNEFLDVAIGTLYLCVILSYNKQQLNNKKIICQRAIPLIFFIMCGISVVFAPGNFARQTSYDAKPNLSVALKQIFIDIIYRLKDIVRYHPLAIILLIGLVYVGIKAGKKQDISKLIITATITLIVLYGTVFPYVYGRAMTTTYLDVRMQYLFDYILFLGMGIGAVQFGGLISDWILDRDRRIQISILVIILGLSAISLLHENLYKKIVQVDIIENRLLIKESYEYWDGILAEIENSKDDDVVIIRKKEPQWSPYFLYCGLVEEDTYNLPLDSIFSLDIILPNVYYQKESIKYIITDNN